ncbi:hypothetical protein BD413DRAFT_548706 [Trametes elegans]|nr:hypothetical protein BD413DRAFT_548706 [Trametes elegans]
MRSSRVSLIFPGPRTLCILLNTPPSRLRFLRSFLAAELAIRQIRTRRSTTRAPRVRSLSSGPHAREPRASRRDASGNSRISCIPPHALPTWTVRASSFSHPLPQQGSDRRRCLIPQWRDEFTVLLDDLVDEDGNVKQSTDLRSDAGIVWSKIHAVYPNITQNQLVRISVDQIIAHDPKIARLFGTTKHITAPGSHTFATEISKYINSRTISMVTRRTRRKTRRKTRRRTSKTMTLPTGCSFVNCASVTMHVPCLLGQSW